MGGIKHLAYVLLLMPIWTGCVICTHAQKNKWNDTDNIKCMSTCNEYQYDLCRQQCVLCMKL